MTATLRPAGRSRRSLAVALGVLTAGGPFATDLYLPAFPALARHFDTSASTVQLTLSASIVGLAVGQLVYGPVSDAYGRRRPILAGTTLFILASVACAFAPSIEALIALRFVQAFGACAGIVISYAVVRDLFSGAQAARFIALILLVFGVAPVIAPLVGGQLLSLAGWESTFFALAGYGLVSLAFTFWLPETHAPERRRTGGLPDALHSYAHVLRSRALVVYAFAGGLSVAAMVTYIAASPAVVIDQYGVSPQAFGFVFGANAAGLVVVSQVAGRLMTQLGPQAILRAAILAQAAAAVALVAFAAAGVGGLPALLVPMFLIVAAIGAVMPASTALALSPFPERAGAASAVVGALQLSLGAGASALVGLVGLDPAASMGVVIASLCSIAVVVLVVVPARRGAELATPASADARS